MNLNFENWSWFDFVDIFDIKKGFYNKKPESSGIGKIPFLGATDHNNGVTEYYTYEEIDSSSRTGDLPNESIERKIYPGNAVCITNNGSVGFAYFQKKEFSCSHDVNPLYRKDGEFNIFTGLFICTVIMHDRYRWGYGRKWRPERMKKSKLMLPSTKEGKPDWDYMEKYIKALNCEAITTNNTNNQEVLSTLGWKKFRFGDLINNEDIYKAKAHSKVELDTSENNNRGLVQYISRTDLNNGIDCYALIDNSDIYENGNAITIGDTTSTVFYQANKFVTGDHMIVIRAEWLNKYTGMFIVSLLKKERFRYSYGRAFLMDSIKNTILLLPSTKDGIPDWNFMENYIKSLPYGDRI